MFNKRISQKKKPIELKIGSKITKDPTLVSKTINDFFSTIGTKAGGNNNDNLNFEFEARPAIVSMLTKFKKNNSRRN